MPSPHPVWDLEIVRPYIPAYGWIRDYLVYALQCTDAPPLYHVMSALALVSNALASNHNCIVDGEAIPLHDFFLVVGESGTRKTAAIKRALKVVQPCYARTKLDHRIWYPEACTPEGIACALEEDPNRLMVLYEWSDLHAGGRASYWQHAPQFWELIFDQQPIQRLKIAKSVKIERPSITILGASTPSLIRQHTTKYDWEAGKMARYLIGYQEKPDDAEMANAVEHPEYFDDLRQNYERLLTPSLVESLQFSEEAKQYKRDWQYSREWKTFLAELPEHLKPSGQRAGDHVLRVAALYQASIDYPYNYVVDAPAVAQAIQFVWWCLDSVKQQFSLLTTGENPQLTRIQSLLQRAGAKGLSRAELLRQAAMHGPELDRVLLTFREREQLQVVKHKGLVIYILVKPQNNVRSLDD
jgi:hypothetical protein